MCRYCEHPAKRAQVSGGGKWSYATVWRDRLDVRLDDRTVSVRIRRCPWCGRKLAERSE